MDEMAMGDDLVQFNEDIVDCLMLSKKNFKKLAMTAAQPQADCTTFIDAYILMCVQWKMQQKAKWIKQKHLDDRSMNNIIKMK